MGIFDPKDRVALYVHLRSFESDFDKSQSQVRAISSAWTAAVLAATALLITTAATPVALSNGGSLVPGGLIEVRTEALAYLRTVVCLVGSGGVLAFWYIDQGLYQRLLHSVFAYGLFVESKEKGLPQVRSAMYLANLDVTDQLGVYYKAQFYLFPVISLGAAAVSHWVGPGVACGVWILVGVHALAALICHYVFVRRWPSLSAILNDYPALKDELPSSAKDGKRAALLKRIRHEEMEARTVAAANAASAVDSSAASAASAAAGSAAAAATSASEAANAAAAAEAAAASFPAPAPRAGDVEE